MELKKACGGFLNVWREGLESLEWIEGFQFAERRSFRETMN